MSLGYTVRPITEDLVWLDAAGNVSRVVYVAMHFQTVPPHIYVICGNKEGGYEDVVPLIERDGCCFERPA